MVRPKIIKSAFAPRRVEGPNSPLIRHMSDWKNPPVAISLPFSHRCCCRRCPPTVDLALLRRVLKNSSPLVTRSPTLPLSGLGLTKPIPMFSIFSTICIALGMLLGRDIRRDAWKTGQKIETKEIPTTLRLKLLGRCWKLVLLTTLHESGKDVPNEKRGGKHWAYSPSASRSPTMSRETADTPDVWLWAVSPSLALAVDLFLPSPAGGSHSHPKTRLPPLCAWSCYSDPRPNLSWTAADLRTVVMIRHPTMQCRNRNVPKGRGRGREWMRRERRCWDPSRGQEG